MAAGQLAGRGARGVQCAPPRMPGSTGGLSPSRCPPLRAACDGGDPWAAIAHIVDAGGIAALADYNYEGADNYCRANRTRRVGRFKVNCVPAAAGLPGASALAVLSIALGHCRSAPGPCPRKPMHRPACRRATARRPCLHLPACPGLGAAAAVRRSGADGSGALARPRGHQL